MKEKAGLILNDDKISTIELLRFLSVREEIELN